MKRMLNQFVDRVLARIHFRSRRHSSRTVKLILAGQSLKYLDIGAAGGEQSRWKHYSDSIDYVLVEPDERSRYELYELFGPSTLIVDKALWSETGSTQMNLCSDPKQSSVYKPNMDLLSKYQLSERYTINSNMIVECSTIDELLSEFNFSLDFIKLDIQGAELKVLSGGQQSLPSVLGVEVEVEFSSQYIDQPLADEVFLFMRNNGFEFLDFVHINRWERTAYSGLGQAMFADAVFIQSPDITVRQVSKGMIPLNKAMKLIAILYIYRRYDLALHMLHSLLFLELIDNKLGKQIETHISRKRNKLKRIQKIILFANRLLDENSRKEPSFPSIHLQI